MPKHDPNQVPPKLSEQSEPPDIVTLGISHIPYDVFLCDQYRYTIFQDALAQARRLRLTAGCATDESGSTTDHDALAAQYGIRREVVDCFHFRDFRYSRVSDAVAEAVRHRAGALPGKAVPDQSQVGRFRRKARQLESGNPRSRFE